jgi:peptidyl-prolyl cis-trans isomerase D
VSSLEAVGKATGQSIVKADSVLFSSTFIPNVGQEPKVIGASFNKNYQAKPSEPIAGNGGVFVIKVDNVSAITNAGPDVQQQQAQMLQNEQRAISNPQVISEILKKTVKITDNRYKFF